MSNYLKKISGFLAAVLPLVAGAQELPQFSHYMFSQGIYNPAYAGTTGAVSGSLLYNKQWAGFSGAPQSQGLNVHLPLGDTRSGMGLTATNQSYGVTSWKNLQLQYAYRIPFAHSQLSLGLQGGAQFFRDKGSDLTTTDPGDDLFRQDFSLTTFNFGFGLHYYSDRFFVGVSIPQLLGNKLDYAQGEFNKSPDFKEMSYNGTIGGVVNLGLNTKFLPSVMVRSNPGAPIVADINLNFMFKDVVWVGPYYRTGAAFGIMAGVQLAERIRIGYAGEIPTSAINGYSKGTHEVMVGFNFRKKGAAGYQSIRYF